MKKLKNFFTELNSLLPDKLGNYELSLESSYEVYKLDSSKKVVLYSVISENEIENIKGSFMYFLEPTTSLSLYVNITNSKEEKVKVLIGRVYSNGTGVYLSLTNYKFKGINRFLRKFFGKKSLGKALYTLPISKEFYESYQYTKFPIPLKKDNYEVVFSNGSKRIFDKEYSSSALDLVAKQNLKIEEVKIKTTYHFQNQPTVLNLID